MTIWVMTTLWLTFALVILRTDRVNDDSVAVFVKAIGLHVLFASVAYLGIAGLSINAHGWAQHEVIPWLGWGSYPGYWISELIYSSDMWEGHMQDIRVRDLNR